MARTRRVYKVGGPALEDPTLVAPLAAEIRKFDGDVALVHGGGRQVEKLLKQLDIESTFVDGRRVTSSAAMDVVEMVLSGTMNKALAAARSYHTGGVNMLLADGSVRFVQNGVSLVTWRALATRAGGEVVGEY